ncbi:putative disease resistance protein RGA1 [Benincasa hispida]|uniref:putative disease resistance protein RGA1 n=1 Tax=Benincasa hispida TaxID=102211 RepID=UPI0018FFCB72|nr:putative disease resistance protein RGA1 [Benincasa hispida]
MAGLLDSVAGNLLGRITEAAGRLEFRDIRSELRNLEMTVSDLKAGIRDAEEKQDIHDELNDLLKQLKDTFSMADSLIEELECEYLKWRVQNRKNGVKGCQFSSCFSSNVFVSPTKTADDINQMTKKLDMIEEAMSKFSLVKDENEYIKRLKGEMTLRTSITGSQAFARLLRLRKEAILSDNVDSIIGRGKAKQSIIDELVKDEDDKRKCPHILSIHGEGGMGKTALAKLVYNAHQVFDHFDKRIWVCVSEDFDVERIRREVLSSATGENVTDALTDPHLLIRLQRKFVDKRFLLVLDDFGVLDAERVLELEKIVKMGAPGSKIMITTRSQKTLNDATTYKIEKLDEEKSMDLFKHTCESKRLTEKVEEYKELVPKCGGAPLAIKCLAGLLSSKAGDGVEWLNVKNSSEKWKPEEVNEGSCVLRALRMSYDLMPSYLKPCFLCFSLLPKDNVFYSFELIQLWMAQGILHSDSKDPEAVGEQYFNELWLRGLLEDVEEHTLGYWFKIHNLVHDLAVEQAKEQKNLENLHQLSFVGCNNKDFRPSPSYDIRYLSIPVGGVEPEINGVPLFKCITKFRQLRFLYLCNTSLEEIPTSINMLRHLRYLDLRGNQRLKRLPESICKLQSLQTLILAFCSELEELPKNIKNMISLRFLWIQTKQANLGKDGIGSLTSLRFLAIGGSENLTHLFEDIYKLNALQTLIIYDCKSLLTLPKGLESLSSLCNMAIWGCERLRLTFSLESLCPRKLILRGLTAVGTLPKWMHHLDENLEVLEIGEFPMLKELPIWYGNYWKLRILGISNCPRLEPSMHTNFGSYCDRLEELRITFCGSLSTQSMEESNHVDLRISHIPTIYVDSKKIKPRVASTEKHEAAGGAGKIEEAEHGVHKDDHESESKHDNINIHGSIGVRQDNRAPLDVLTGAKEIGRGELDRATNDNHLEADNESNVGTGQPSKAEHDEQIVDAKQDDANDNKSDVGVGQTMGLKLDGITDESHVGAKQITKAKKDGATGESHVDFVQIGGAKHNNIDIHGLRAAKESHAGARQTGRGKHDRATNDNHHQADNESHVGTGQPLKPDHDEQTVGTKQDDANDKNSYVGVGQTMGLKVDGITDESHVGAKQTIEAKKDGAADDNQVGIGQIGAEYVGEANKKHVEVGKIGAKLGGANENGHDKVCLGDDDHAGADQGMIITYEGF